MAALVTLDEIRGRIDWTLSPGEELMAQAAIDDLSEDARFYSGAEWALPADAPTRILSLILRAAVRFLRNPEGASQSRAGDETLMWDNRANEKAGSPYFTDDEIAEIKGGGSGTGSGLAFGTLGVWAWNNGTGRRDLTVETDPGYEPMPWVSADDEIYW